MVKTNYFGPIQSAKEAEDSIKETSWTLLGLGVLDIVVGFFVIPSIIADGFIWIILALLINKFRTKLVAGILAIFAVISCVVTLLAKAGVLEGGQNIFLAVIIVWAAYRVWQSVSYLKRNNVEFTPNFMSRRSFIVPVSIILICSAGFLLWNSYFYRVASEEVVTTDTANVFTDTKFGYSIEFPKNWKLDRYAAAPGAIEGYDPLSTDTKVLVWYKDSNPITDQDELVAFVGDDRKYGEEQQGIKTISLEKTDIGSHKAVRWRLLGSDGLYSDTYYFYAPKPYPQTQAIWVWFVSVTAKTEEELSLPVVLDTIKTFKILD